MPQIHRLSEARRPPNELDVILEQPEDIMRHSQSPPSYRTDASDTPTPSPRASPPHVQDEPNERQLSGWVMSFATLHSKPYHQFKAEVAEEIIQMREGSSHGTRSFPANADFLELAKTKVKERWVELGIWDQEWTSLSMSTWKHEHSLEIEPELEPQQDPGQQNRQHNDHETRRRKRILALMMHEREASKPLHMFNYQLLRRREWIEERSRFPGAPALDPYDINTIAYNEVKEAWVKRGIWDSDWTVMPGMRWKHEGTARDMILADMRERGRFYIRRPGRGAPMPTPPAPNQRAPHVEDPTSAPGVQEAARHMAQPAIQQAARQIARRTFGDLPNEETITRLAEQPAIQQEALQMAQPAIQQAVQQVARRVAEEQQRERANARARTLRLLRQLYQELAPLPVPRVRQVQQPAQQPIQQPAQQLIQQPLRSPLQQPVQSPGREPAQKSAREEPAMNMHHPSPPPNSGPIAHPDEPSPQPSPPQVKRRRGRPRKAEGGPSNPLPKTPPAPPRRSRRLQTADAARAANTPTAPEAPAGRQRAPRGRPRTGNPEPAAAAAERAARASHRQRLKRNRNQTRS